MKRWTGLLATLLVLWGCAGSGALGLRQAQDLYNEGIELENTSRLNGFEVGFKDDEPAIGAVGVTPEGCFAASLEILEGLEESKLREVGLLPTKIVVEALCHWRLGRTTKAAERARVAAEIAGDSILERDRVLALALPGMIRIDEAQDFVATATGDPERTANRVKAMLIGRGGAAKSASELLEAARASSSQTDMQLILLWYELDAYGTWWKLQYDLVRRDVDSATKCEIDELLDAMEALPGGNVIAIDLRSDLPDDCEE